MACTEVEICYQTSVDLNACVGAVEITPLPGTDTTVCSYPVTVGLRAACPGGSRARWSQRTGHRVEHTELNNTDMEYTITEPHPVGYEWCATCDPL